VRIAERPTLSSDLRLARTPVGEAAVWELPEEERAIAATMVPTRWAEFCAGRRAARAALSALLGAGDYVIIRNAEGAPLVVGVDVRLSITHTRGEAAAVAGTVAAVGVDLCPVADGTRVERISRRFIVPAEREMCGGTADWALLWALKEAGAKAVGVGLLDGGLKATRLQSLRPARFASPALDAATEIDDEVALAVVWR
jgi:4'-phosphopantetheinyl transferase EntD